jgi:hypothetical protein
LLFIPLDVLVWSPAGFSIDLDLDWLFISGFILWVFLHFDENVSSLLSKYRVSKFPRAIL